LGVGLAGEGLAAQAVERLQLGFALLQMLLGQGLFRPLPGGAAVDGQPALADPGLDDADGPPPPGRSRAPRRRSPAPG